MFRLPIHQAARWLPIKGEKRGRPVRGKMKNKTDKTILIGVYVMCILVAIAVLFFSLYTLRRTKAEAGVYQAQVKMYEKATGEIGKPQEQIIRHEYPK